ncbi:MAG: PHP domain-containing protein [Anaerofustis sp.]
MNRYFGDYHIHSALSPCADDDMTPANIIGMAAIKGLDMISVTDHNSAGNLPALKTNADANQIVLIPGIEINSKEEVHILAYFPDIESCISYANDLYRLLPDIPNDEQFFGRQLFFDEEDEVIGKAEKLLINSVSLSVEQIIGEVADSGGATVFAHIDKKHFSILSSLGFIPLHLPIQTVEISTNTDPDPFLQKNHLMQYQYLQSSDAHMLQDIRERVFSLPLEEKTVSCFLDYVKNGHK